MGPSDQLCVLVSSNQIFLKGAKLWKFDASKVENPIDLDQVGRVGSQLGEINSWIASLLIAPLGFQWDYLAHLYVQTNSAKRYQLEWEIQNAQQGKDTIHEFYIRKTTLWVSLSFTEPQFINATFETQFQIRLVQFLITLKIQYEHNQSILTHQSPLLSVDAASTELRAEKQTQSSLANKTTSKVNHVLVSTAAAMVQPTLHGTLEPKGSHWHL